MSDRTLDFFEIARTPPSNVSRLVSTVDQDRITSYNVCYTKLLRVLERGALIGAILAADARKADEALVFARARDALRTEVPRLRPEQDLASAARELRGSGMTSLPVVDEAGDLVGA